MNIRLGIDLGSNSLGWCLVRCDEAGEGTKIIDSGVRLFPDGRDPKDGTSLAVARREARGARRRRDRFLRRRNDLMDALIQYGLMPQDGVERKKLEKLDPYELRAKGIGEELPLHHLGRALFHLHQRRGFKSNRKTDQGNNEKGAIKEGIRRLKEDMFDAGCASYGAYLAKLRDEEHETIRARPISPLDGADTSTEITTGKTSSKITYRFYPERALVEDEFAKLWQKQSEYHDELHDEARKAIHDTIFRQRDLRPVEPGKCTFFPEDDRAPKALPQAQLFRIYQETVNLKIRFPGVAARFLSREEQKKIIALLCGRSSDVSFDIMRKTLKFPENAWFNLESEKRKTLKCDETAKILANKKYFGAAWRSFPLARQTEIIEKLLQEEKEDALINFLSQTCDIDRKKAEAISDAVLPVGYINIGCKALAKIMDAWPTCLVEETDPNTGEITDHLMRYDEVVKEVLGKHHSDLRIGEEDRLQKLPFYGEILTRHVVSNSAAPEKSQENIGRVANPTVHVALNQLRHVVNAILQKHGSQKHSSINQIVVEMTRELKNSFAKRKEIEQEQSRNQKKNEKRKERLKEIGIPDPGGQDIWKLRLWEELNPDNPCDRRCPYSGKQISIQELFSDRCEIEHILPFKRSLDDSLANKTIALREANRDKGNKTPYEAFGERDDWPEILSRAQNLAKNKSWRFAPDAMERFEKPDKELGIEGFLARQLHDTSYMARLAKNYLGHICNSDKIWVTPGRLTAMIRGKWGLNQLLPDHNYPASRQKKDRKDHRHHAIDAFVIACTTRSLLQKIAKASDEQRGQLIKDMPEPWPGFREELRKQLEAMIISIRPDHNCAGRLHEETAYGLVTSEGEYNLVFRKAIQDLTVSDIRGGKQTRIRDANVREELQSYLDHHIGAEKKAIGEFSKAELNRRRQKAIGEFVKAELNHRRQKAEAEGRNPKSEHPIRHIRVLKKLNPEYLVKIADHSGENYKAYDAGDNDRIEIFQIADGKWQGEAVTVFQANQKDYRPKWPDNPEARLVMRVRKKDLLETEYEGERKLFRVYELRISAKLLVLAAHYEAGDLQKRHKDENDPFCWFFAGFGKLQKGRARRMVVDPLGRLVPARDR